MARLFVPTEVPTDIEERLKQIDPDFYIKRIQTVNLDSSAADAYNDVRNAHLVDRLAVCLKWGERDPRWMRVRRGEYPESNAFDLVCMLPADITIDQVPGFLLNSLRTVQAPKQIMDEVAKWNQDQMIRNGRGVFEYSQEVLDRVEQARKKGKAQTEVPDPLSE